MAPTNILRAASAKPRSAGAGGARAPSEPRIAVLRVGRAVLRLKLRATATADRLWRAMPLYGVAEVWGTGAVHFKTRIETGRDGGARQNVRRGDIGYWVEDDRVIIAFGATPLSRDGEMRMPSPVNIWADAIDDVGALETARPGERVALLHADS